MKTDSAAATFEIHEEMGAVQPRPSSVAPDTCLRENVRRALQNYFQQVDGEEISDLYEMVLAEVEIPLLEAVMEHTGSNQTKASNVLGLNRGTLRKKLKQYDML